jgi:hypothetical protein
MVSSDRSEEFKVAGAHFCSILMSFSCFNYKKHALAVSHLTVTLRMMSYNRRLYYPIGIVHKRLILQEVSHSPNEEVQRDVIS